MRAYVLSRLAQTALVVFLSLTAVFAMVRLSGDPVLLFMPMDIQAKDVNEFRQRLGFNDPLPVQYARFVGGATRGDFGESLRYRRDALGLVLERLPATFLLAATSLLLTTCVAVPLGILSAVRRNTLLDHASTVSTVLGQATPGFWLGLMLIYVFSVQLRWPADGRDRRRRSSRHAVDRAGGVLLRPHRAPDALGGARRAGRGVRPDGARQGARRGARDRQAHASQLGDPDRDARRARGGPGAGRRGDHRDHLRVAGPRPAPGSGAAQSRFPRGLRRGLRDLAHVHADQPA